MRATICKPFHSVGRLTLSFAQIFTLLFCFVNVSCIWASDSPWTSAWYPSEHLTNMAFCLAENYSRYVLAPRFRQGTAKGNVAKDGYEDMSALTNNHWLVFGHPYTNYVRQCRAFAMKSSDGRFFPVIAVQHFLMSNEDMQFSERGFTLYYNLCDGTISSELGLSHVMLFSPFPPYHLSPPVRDKESRAPVREDDQDISVEIVEPVDGGQTLRNTTRYFDEATVP